jgi:hypothetical protein
MGAVGARTDAGKIFGQPFSSSIPKATEHGFWRAFQKVEGRNRLEVPRHNYSFKLWYCVGVGTHREVSRRLYAIAETQQGFFTTKQAKDAGYRENTHTYHAKVGNWVREHRGIYRLAQFPPAKQPDLVRWALWSRNRRQEIEGVYSHLTALSLCGFAELNLSQLHMTVPTRFRRNSKVPDILILHYADLPESDVESAPGFKFTCPQRTVLDLVEALRQGVQHGRLTAEQIESACLTGPARKLCARILRRV